MEKETKMKYTCKSCGAEVEADFAYCPYCGTINIVGAEKEYFRDLENVRQDLADMGDDSKEEFQNTVKSGSGFALKTFIIVGSIVLAFVLIALLANYIEDLRYEKAFRDAGIEESYYPKEYPELDKMYEDGQYSELVAYLSDNADELGSDIYSWKHYYFISAYKYHEWLENDIQWVKDEEAIGKISKDSQKWVVYSGLLLVEYSEFDNDLYIFTAEEQDMIDSWALEVPGTFNDILDIDDEEYNAMHEYFLCEDRYEKNRFISLDTVDNYLKKNKLYRK